MALLLFGQSDILRINVKQNISPVILAKQNVAIDLNLTLP